MLMKITITGSLPIMVLVFDTDLETRMELLSSLSFFMLW